mmetsp:Transcript_35839/g.36295  ORF Transcript_35839/g.36295 Transcript_35839/m.36295 type:complete len:88 (+) Transcript_35839:413-676(+)
MQIKTKARITATTTTTTTTAEISPTIGLVFNMEVMNLRRNHIPKIITKDGEYWYYLSHAQYSTVQYSIQIIKLTQQENNLYLYNPVY